LYAITDVKESKNLPIYIVEKSMGCYILSINPEVMIEIGSPPDRIEEP